MISIATDLLVHDNLQLLSYYLGAQFSFSADPFSLSIKMGISGSIYKVCKRWKRKLLISILHCRLYELLCSVETVSVFYLLSVTLRTIPTGFTLLKIRFIFTAFCTQAYPFPEPLTQAPLFSVKSYVLMLAHIGQGLKRPSETLKHKRKLQTMLIWPSLGAFLDRTF